ncbi:recombinase family protein [Actinomadura fulvescens]|uniref:recombinase family protein n=1 Tax=Actinomadura fulvescens TaxID=46160 RepID=UPI0031D06454
MVRESVRRWGAKRHACGGTHRVPRCSTVLQDLTAQRQALTDHGVADERIYLDKGLTGTSRARPGPDQAPGCRPRRRHPGRPQARPARSVPDARQIGDSLVERGVKLSLGGSLYDPADPMGKMFFNILATFAEFEVDLLKLRTREGMAIARSKGELKGKRPKLTALQQAELVRMHRTGEYTIADLTDVFSIGCATVYRVAARHEPAGTPS